MASIDERLWAELSELLQDKEGWSVQDAPTPGAPPVWTRSPRGRVDYSVGVADGALYLYEEKTDEEVRFETVENLAAGLNSNEATALKTTSQRQPLMRWR